MSRLTRLINEIHRRSLWQVLSIYLISAWVALQVADTVTAALGLPDWVPQVALVLLIVLLPVVVATAFVQEGVGRGAGGPEVAETIGAEAAEAEPGREAELRVGARSLLTWRNAIVAAVAMLALLAASAGGYMGLRAAGVGPFGTLMSKGVLEERDRIVLADFENRTNDPLLAIAATQLFRTALSQSTAVHVAGEEYVANVLRRMEREPDARLDYQLAREVAVRQGLKAVTAGEVIAVGGGYVVSARLVAAETGEELWTDSETARDSTAIIDSIDRLSRRLRERIGESLRTIRGNRPLDQVTTSSLEALRKYSQSIRAIHVEGDFGKGVGLLGEAVALDTAFAMAHLQLSYVFSVAEMRTRSVEAIARAYRHRDRLTDRERYLTIAGYYLATGEHEQAITVCRTLLDAYPDDAAGLSLLELSYLVTQQFDRAEEVVRREIELYPSKALTYWALLNLQVSRGELQEAQATLDQMIENGNPFSFPAGVWFAIAREDYEGAVGSLRAFRESQTEGVWEQAWISVHLAGVARLRGKLAEAEREFGGAMAAYEAVGWEQRSYLCFGVRLALLRSQVDDGVERAVQTVEDALARYPLATIPVLDRPYLELAEFYAIAGKLDQARTLLAEHDAAIDPTQRWATEWLRRSAEGHIAVAEGRYEEAIAAFRLADDRSPHTCRWCALPPLADAYDLAGVPDSAVAVYERFLAEAVVGIEELQAASGYLPSAYERLGALYEQRGDRAKASSYYGKLLNLWHDADAQLQPRVDAARRAIGALSPDR